ncbi:hypothetical protein [Desulforegula conservatrix]|uniref:hypothetical protein n=1 Tax=Desulforegula conservatrix TaxID=153026 RepID=UPI0003F960D3|nr:hypothetical protein [Desulforegula conservatrix]
MKYIIWFFLVGTIIGAARAIARSRRHSSTHENETFECTDCDDNNCECHKKNE